MTFLGFYRNANGTLPGDVSFIECATCSLHVRVGGSKLDGHGTRKSQFRVDENDILLEHARFA